MLEGVVIDGAVAPKTPGTEQSRQNNTAGMTADGRTKVLGLEELELGLIGSSALSTEGAQYIEQLRTRLTSTSIQQKLAAVGELKVYVPGNPQGVVLVSCGSYCIMLLLDEAVVKSARQTSTALEAVNIINKLTTYFSEKDLVDILVIHKLDYSRVEQAAAYIGNRFIVRSNARYNSITIDDFSSMQNKNCRWTIELGTSACEELDRASPHAVPPRRDFGVALVKRIDDNTNTNIGAYVGGALGKSEASSQVVLAVGAYVTFISTPVTDQSGMPVMKYMPEIHITSIDSIIPVKGAIIIALGLVSFALVRTQVWKQRFRDLTGDSPKLADLFEPVTAGGQFKVDSIDEIETLFRTYFTDPVIVLDVAQGRAGAYGLSDFANPALQNALCDELNAFFKTNIFNHNVTLSFGSREIGYSTWNNSVWSDSRSWDFLAAVKAVPARRADLQMLLSKVATSLPLNEVLSNVLGIKIDPLYHNEEMLCGGDTISSLAMLVQQCFRLNSLGAQQELIDTSIALTEGARMASSFRGTNGVAYNGMTMSTIYR